MPEGDTVYRHAAWLQTHLVGREITALRSPILAIRQAGWVGATIESVISRGKHLLLTVRGRGTLHVHLRMSGFWSFDPAQEVLRGLRVAIETAAHRAILCDAPVCEYLLPSQLAAHTVLNALGPDLLADPFDAAEALRRIEGAGERAIGDVLLDQRCLAGIGNVYKSEVLFIERVDPFAPVRAVSPEKRAALVARAEVLLKKNLGPAPRRTCFELGRGRYYVYERHRRPCFRCQTAVEFRRESEQGRSTYYCPRCQGVSRGRPGA